MAFIFSMRSTGADIRRSHDYTSTSTLPAIVEDGRSSTTSHRAPDIPQRAANRPTQKSFGLGAVRRSEREGGQPVYNYFDAAGGPNGEKLADVRKGEGGHNYLSTRGGWKRLLLIVLVVILCLAGFVVGLVIGLRHRHNSASTKNDAASGTGSTSPGGGASGDVSSGPVNPATNTTFPAGSYAIETFLDTVATNCTSNPSTWSCYPYSTYAESPSSSAATFDWIIDPVPGTKNYTISSTQNFFSIVFTNVSLSLEAAGTAQEHYFFQISMQKPVRPSVALTSSNAAATCNYNATTFQAYMYTKLPKTYPPNSTTSGNSTAPFSPWPFALKVEQVAAAGPGTPSCVDSSGNSLGDFSVSDGTQLCDCLYLNTGT